MSVFHRKPRVFVSAVTDELGEYRNDTANWLSDNGYIPVTMGDFGTNPNNVKIRDTIRKKLRSCQAIICLIGDGYGFEPKTTQRGALRQSYTQSEYHTAFKFGLTVYTFFTRPGMQKNELNESPELRELQSAFRKEILSERGHHHHFGNTKELYELLTKLEGLKHPLSLLRLSAALVALIVVFLGAIVAATRTQPQTDPQAKNAQPEQKAPTVHEKHKPPSPKITISSAPKWRAVKLEGTRVEIDGADVTNTLSDFGKQILGITPSDLTEEDKQNLRKARLEQQPTFGVIYFATEPFEPHAPIEGVDLKLPVGAWVSLGACVEARSGSQTLSKVASNGWEHNFGSNPTSPRFATPIGDFEGTVRLLVRVYPFNNKACNALRTPPTISDLSIKYRER